MATGNTASYTSSVTNLPDLYEKTNTAVMTGIKTRTEEYEWGDDMPDLMITPSANEMRIPLKIQYQTGVAMIPEGGYEAVLGTAATIPGTVSFVQMNKRYSITGLGQAFDKRGRAGMIIRQTAFSAQSAVEAMARSWGLDTYGFSTGTKAVIVSTLSAGTVQNGIGLKNAYGSSLIPATTTNQLTYLSNIFRAGENVAIIRSGVLIEFGNVVASPSVASGVGFIDATFNSSITPTAGDLLVFANAVIDATVTGTDKNNAPNGFLDALTSTSLHGVSGSTYGPWNAAYANTAGGRWNFQLQEAMATAIANASGLKMDRIILSQGVRRDAIAGERAAMRYDSTDFNLQGDLGGFKYLTSVLAPPGMAIGWYSGCVYKKLLSDKPGYEAGPSIFSLDKVQDRSATAAKFDLFYFRAFTARGGLGYASALTEQ